MMYLNLNLILHNFFILHAFLFTETPTMCTSIGYAQTWERVEGGDTTNSIMSK